MTKLADPSTVRVYYDGSDFPRCRVVAEDAAEIDCEIGDHRFTITTRGPKTDDPSDRGAKRAGAGEPTSLHRGERRTA